MEMPGIALLRKKILHTTFLLCVLFSLAPCSVKSSFLTSIDIEHSLPFNKTKTTHSSNYSSCDVSHSVTNTSKEYNTTISTQFNFSKDKVHPFILTTVPKKYHFEKLTSGNSPPLYILYKRLKLDLA